MHAEAKTQLTRLFPNHVVDVGPKDTEPEPDPVITEQTGDDFDGADTNDAGQQAAFLQVVVGQPIDAINPAIPTIAFSPTTTQAAGTPGGAGPSGA